MLKGKTAVITGSTSGIGLGVAQAFAAEGCNIMLNGFGKSEEIQSIQDELEKSHGVKVSYNGADMSKPDEIKGLIDDTVQTFGSIDVLVNNAGIQHTDPIDQFPEAKWDAIIAINMSSNFHSIKAALPHMRKQGWGRIINVASVHGLVASPEKAAYIAAKHGVVGLTKVVGLETAKEPITCNAICPGWVLTPLVQKQIDDKAKKENLSADEAKKALLGAKQPSLEFTTVEQLGGLAVFLCSDAASNITGAAYNVDGGWYAQ